MADTKISALPAASAAAGAMELPVNDAGTTKKLTLTLLEELFQKNIAGNSGAAGGYKTTLRLTSNYTNSTTTPSVAMTLTGVGPGTYYFRATLMYQAAATGTGIGVAANHSGTTGKFVTTSRFISTGAAAATGVADQASATAAGQMMEGKSERAKNTFSSNTAGVDTLNADMMMQIEGLFVVTASGDFTINVRSSAASQVTVLADSILVLEKVS